MAQRPGLQRGISSVMQSKTVVLVTGANQGIGFEIVKSLATRHPKDYQILLGTRSIPQGEAAAASLGAPLNINPIQIDVTDDASIAHCAGAIEQTFGKLDVLINNAGIATRAVRDVPEPREKWRRILDVNVVGAALVTDAMAPLLNQSERPSVIMVTSELGSVEWCLTSPNWVDGIEYSVSKSAINGLVGNLVRRHKAWRINACCPGFTASELDGVHDVPGLQETWVGAVRAVQLVEEMGKKDGEAPNGTNSTKDGPVPW